MHTFLFINYDRYLKSHNRFKSYLISQLNKIRNIITDDLVYFNLKKELLPYFIKNIEIKVLCDNNSYKIELNEEINEKLNEEINEKLNEEINEKNNNEELNKDLNEIINNELNKDDDNKSECSTVDLNNNLNSNKNDEIFDIIENDDDENYNNQTYLVDADESDEESLIEIAMSKVKLEDLKPSELKRLNIYELRNLLKSNDSTISKNGIYLTKKDMIRKLLKMKNSKL
jgi:hypothetical protein